MKKVLYIILISLFSLTIFSCAKEEEEAPVIAEVYPVATPTSDPSPDYTFSSTKDGTITYGGSCSSGTTSATSGNNTITFLTLSDGTYSDCTIIVTDSDGNASNTLAVTTFIVDATAPTVSSIYPTDNQSDIPLTTDNISVTFSEAMDNSTVTTNSTNTSCSGSFQVSSDNFSSCIQMSSSPSSSNSDKTFTLDPYDNLAYQSTYKTRVTTGVKDAAGNAMSSQYETSSGFTTFNCSNGCFVAVGNSGNIVISADNGITWDNVTSPTSNILFAVGSGNNTFVGVGRNGNIVRSTDNMSSWDNATSGLEVINGNYHLRGVSFGNNTFVAAGNYGTTVRSTDNGSSWDNFTDPDKSWFHGIGFGNNTFVAVSSTIKMVKSTDNGSTWDNASSSSSSRQLNDVAFGNNTFMTVGFIGTILTSSDNGSSWTYRTIGSAVLKGVTFGNNTFVAVGELGKIVRSTDNGSSFSTVTSPTSNYLYGIGFGNNTFVAVGDSGTIVRSTDNGSTWDNVTSPTANDLNGITF